MKSKNSAESDRRGVMIYYEMLEQFELLSKRDLGELLLAIMRYSKDGTKPELTKPELKMIFSFMKRFDDSDRARYANIVEQRRQAGAKSAQARKAE